MGGTDKFRTKFLLFLKNAEAQRFMDAMLLKQKCVDFINHHYVYNYSNLDDLRKMTSDNHWNGKLLLFNYRINHIILFRTIFYQLDGMPDSR